MIQRARQVCPLCKHPQPRSLAGGPADDFYRCHECGVDFANYCHASDHDVSENDTSSRSHLATTAPADHFAEIDATRYDRSVRVTRRRSYARLSSEVGRHVPQGRWLDIGCSYGWLLEHASQHGYQAVGIEPSASAAAQANALGCEVRVGSYPEAMVDSDRFDVVSLIDVLEHLADPVAALQRLKQHLQPNGVVVIQVPDQACLLYRTATALCRASRGRFDFAFRRLWLTELDFPHQFYFTRASLLSLLERCGYQLLESYRSPISSPRQAFDRVGYYRPGPGSSSLMVACAVGALNAVDTATGYGGLLTVVARPKQAQP